MTKFEKMVGIEFEKIRERHPEAWDEDRCQLCSYAKHSIQMVMGRGTGKYGVMLIGEGPGREEDQEGIPFVGAAGRLLDRAIKAIGADRADLYISNVCKCRPTHNETPTTENAMLCMPFLEAEIESLKKFRKGAPVVLVPMGNSPLWALTGEDSGITNKRGKIRIKEDGVFILPTLHPSYVNRLAQEVQIKKAISKFQKGSRNERDSFSYLMHDLNYAIKIGKEGFEEVTHDYTLVDTLEAFLDLMNRLEDKNLRTAFDVETTGLEYDDIIVGIGVGVDKGRSYYVPIRRRVILGGDFLEDAWGPMQSFIIGKFKEYLEDPERSKTAHNGKFDCGMLYNDLGIYPRGFVFDTMLAHHLIDVNERHRLKGLATRYSDLVGYEKELYDSMPPGLTFDAGGIAKLPPSIVCGYCGGDCDATLRLATDFDKELVEERVDDLFYSQTMPLSDVLLRAELHGIKVDTDLVKKLIKEMEVRMRVIEKVVVKAGGRPVNINSPTDLAKLLFDELKLHSPQRSTAAGILEEMKKQSELPALILEYRSLAKWVGTYLKGLNKRLDANGRVHSSFLIHGTRTGRVSSENPNLLNIPRDQEGRISIRQIFVAPRGYRFLDSDYAQAEVRALAFYTQDPTLLAAFDRDEDIHSSVASMMFGLKPEKVTKDKRQSAKSIVFGLIYGRGANSIAAELGVTHREAHKLIRQFFKMMPSVEAWIEGVWEQAGQDGLVRNVFGRIRRLPNMYSENKAARAEAERQSVNTIIQGTASEITLNAIIAIDKAWREEELDSTILLTVYDSIMAETLATQVDEAQEIMNACMIAPPFPKWNVPLKVDYTVSRRWGKQL